MHTSNPMSDEHFARVLALSEPRKALLAARLTKKISVQDDPALSQLVAYIVPKPSQPLMAKELREFLTHMLPSYMVPSSFMFLDALPMSPNGKLDRQALPMPTTSRPDLETTFVAPRSPTERRLAMIWSEILDVEDIGVEDYFFELGGHSLLATQLISRIRDVFLADIPLRALFEHPTVAGLARQIETIAKESAPMLSPLVPVPRDHDLPLSFTQLRHWFLHELDPHSPVYNITDALRLVGRLDIAALEQSLAEIVQRHEILRTRFPSVQGMPIQQIQPSGEFTIDVTDLSGLASPEREQQGLYIAIKDARRPFDIAQSPPLHVRLVRLSDHEHILILAVHHIIADAWSFNVLFEELITAYAAFAHGGSAYLPPLPIQYADYAVWEQTWLQGEAFAKRLAYWKQRLAHPPAALRLPTDYPRPDVQTNRSGTERFVIPQDLVQRLHEVSRQEQTTVFVTLLAGFAALLARRSGQTDIVLGAPFANRRRIEVEQMIGCFINAVALRIDLTGQPNLHTLQRRVREIVLEAHTYQDIPFQKVVEVLQLKRDPSRPTLFQVIFNFTSVPAFSWHRMGLEVTALPIDTGMEAKYDLALYVSDEPGTLSGRFVYSADVFKASTIQQLIQEFLALLVDATAHPDEPLITFPTGSSSERSQLMTAERDSSGPRKLPTMQRKAVKLTPQSMTQARFFQPDQYLPLVIEPKTEVDLVGWTKGNLEYIQAKLQKYGAILFRGFAVEAGEIFEQFARAITRDLLSYVEGSSPCIMLSDQTSTSTEYPPHYGIALHNKLSYAHKWPGKIFFYCHKAPDQGSEMPLADSRKVLDLLSPDLVERFIQKGVTYICNMHAERGAGLSWATVFETTDKAEIEAYCREGNIEFRWKEDGGLWTSQVRPAVIHHPKTGERLWFNQVDQWHPSSREHDILQANAALHDETELPINASYGDGTPFQDAELAAIREAFRKARVALPWQVGDVLLVDNMLVAHGRMPFSGPSNVVAAMGETVFLRDVDVARSGR